MEPIIIIIWLALSFGVAAIAQTRGHSGGLFFVVSILFSPLIGIIAACAIPSPKN